MMPKFITLSSLFALTFFLFLTPCSANPPTMVNYQGIVEMNDTPFNGTGYFKFAITNGAGTSFWSNDATSSGGSQPTASVPLAVTDGLFNVLLGDTSLTGMTEALTASVFSGSTRRLKIWFSHDDVTFELLGPSSSFASVPYALQAPQSGSFWSLSGNAGTTPGTDFVGTTDNQPLVVKVNGNRALRIEPTTSAPSIVGGRHTNSAGGFAGVAIAGGGRSDGANVATSDHAAIGGGYGNAAGWCATVAGGENNTASGMGSAVLGGAQNTASGAYASVLGGVDCVAGGDSSLTFGDTCIADANFGVALGLFAEANHPGAFVWSSNLPAFASTDDDQFLVNASGGVGIGTNAPRNQLHVQDSINNSGIDKHVAQIENASTGTAAKVLALKVGRTDDPGTANNFVTFYNGLDNACGSIEGNGSGGVSYGSASGDYAEWLPRLKPKEKIEAGDIVGVFGGKISKAVDGADQVMVVSSQPIVLGNDPGEDLREKCERVAFMGQVQVKVHGRVSAGQFIVASKDGVGVAISAAELQPDQLPLVVGQAWETSRERSEKKVLALVGFSHHHPSMIQMAQQIATLEEQITSLQKEVKAAKSSDKGDWFGLGIVSMVLGVILYGRRSDLGSLKKA